MIARPVGSSARTRASPRLRKRGPDSGFWRHGTAALCRGHGAVTVYGGGLIPQHARLLAASAIDVGVARERGYVTADTKTRLEGLGFGPPRGASPR